MKNPKPAKRKKQPTRARATKPAKRKPSSSSKPKRPSPSRPVAPPPAKPAKPSRKPARPAKPAAARPISVAAAEHERELARRRKQRRERAAELERQRLARNAAARKRYAEARGIRQQREAERLERLERARQRRKEKAEAKRAGIGKPPPDERTLAIGWLEQIRNVIARRFACSLVVTEAGGGHAELDGAPAQLAAQTPWLVVGRYDPQDEIDYQTLARGLQDVADDLVLEAMIHPQRLSQIRVVFHDPKSNRGEGDSVVSKIGAWEYILGDLIGELVGSDFDSPDEDSLAGRYDETTVPHFYIFFSTEIQSYATVGPWAKTQTVKLRK